MIERGICSSSEDPSQWMRAPSRRAQESPTRDRRLRGRRNQLRGAGGARELGARPGPAAGDRRAAARTGDESDPRRGRGFWEWGSPVERGQLGERAVPVVEFRRCRPARVWSGWLPSTRQGQLAPGPAKEVASVSGTIGIRRADLASTCQCMPSYTTRTGQRKHPAPCSHTKPLIRPAATDEAYPVPYGRRARA